MGDGEGLDFRDVAAIVRGALNFGRLRLHPKALMFKSQKNGKIDQYSASDICEIQWMRASRGYQILVLTNNNTVGKFIGLEEKNKEEIKKFISAHYESTFVEKEPFVKGWNWGSVDFNGPLMTFHNENKPMFEVPLSDVSAATTNKNEVTVEFHQDDDNDLSLVEMRFYVPNVGGNDDDVPADKFQKSVMKFADVIKATGDVIVKFEQVLLQTPRGRYDVDMYPSFLRLHGKSYDYKIPYSTIIRLFLLPHNDQRSVYFVITTDPPIRQGQTRYPHIVIQFIKDDWSDLTLELDEETLSTKYEGKLQKEMAGPTYETFSKVMKFVVGQKIFVPGTFVSSTGSQAIACSHKANSGHLYPLEKGFMYVIKPPVHIRFDEVASVNFSRVASGVGQSRSFDLEIETKTGANYIFASIEKKEYSKLFDFLKSKKIRIQNTKNGDDAFQDDFGDGSGSDNEMPDHYLEKMKAEGQERDSEDSDESEDADFVAGETPDTSPSSSSETGAEGEDGKKKKKKVVKETEIGKEPKEKRSPTQRKERSEKKTRGKKKDKDPNKPKKPATAYFLWLADNRAKIKEEFPGITITEIAKKAGEMWRGLTSADKQEYDDQTKVLKAAYDVKIKEYNRELALNPPPTPTESPPKKKKTSKASSGKTAGKKAASSTAYKSKEIINTDDDLSSDTDGDKPLKPKSPVKKETKSKSSKEVAKSSDEEIKEVAKSSDEEIKEVAKSSDEEIKEVAKSSDEEIKEVAKSSDEEIKEVAKSSDEEIKEVAKSPDKEKKKSHEKKKRKREEEAASSSKKEADSSDADDSDVAAPADDSSSSGAKSPPAKRSMRGQPVQEVGNLPDDTFPAEDEWTDGEKPPESESSESD